MEATGIYDLDEEILNNIFSEESEETAESFNIKDDNLADWAVEQIKKNNKEYDRLIGIASAKIDVLSHHIEILNAERDKKNSYLTGKLREYFNTVEHKKAKTQESYKLLSGSLVLKKGTVSYIRDNDKLTDWLQKSGNDKYIKIEKTPKWAELKENVVPQKDGTVIDRETGEVVEGVHTEMGKDTFSIK